MDYGEEDSMRIKYFFPPFFLLMMLGFAYIAFYQNERIDDVASTASDFCLELKGLPVHFHLEDLKAFIESEGRYQGLDLNVIQIIVPGRLNDNPRILKQELNDLKLQKKFWKDIQKQNARKKLE